MYAIELDSLSKIFYSDFLRKPTTVLNNLSLKVQYGTSFGLLGSNGAGKTTTMKLILGLLKPSGGTIKIFNESFQVKQVRMKIGYMPENPYFYNYLTGYEFLSICADLYGMDPDTKRERINDLVDMVGMKERCRIRLGRCSKGMVQRIGIAQAIINDPQLVMLDEPMSGLDPVGRKDIRDIILDLKKAGETIFFNSHILSDVELICDEVSILKQGHLLALKNIDEVLEEHQTLERFFVSTITGSRDHSEKEYCRVI